MDTYRVTNARSAARWSFLVALILSANTHFLAAQPISNIIADIVIAGNQRVDTQVIRDLIQTKPGQFYLPDLVKQDTERLMKSGDFDAVNVELDQVDGKVLLTYRVTERPLVKAIRIEGAQAIKLRKIQDELSTKVGQPLNQATLKNDLERIRKLYANRGYAQTIINYETRDAADATGSTVIFKIKEGLPSYVKEVHVSGNKNISTTRITWVMETKPRLLILFRKGVFDEYTLKEDIWRITELYQKAGFAEVKVDYEVKPTADRAGLAVFIKITEGLPHFVGRIVIRQAKLRGFLATNLFYEVEMYKGGIFSPQAVEKDTENIQNYYRSLGYANVAVIPKSVLAPQPDPTKRVVDVYFEVKEGSLYDFGNVVITGNKRTKDLVIRRELNILPGDRYNYYRLETSRQRLLNLDYFEKVDIREADSKTLPNAKDVYINVAEKRTGRIGFGAGYSSVDQFVGFGEISQANFDALNWRNWFVGGGQKVRLRAEVGNRRQDVVFSFTEPYFLYETLRGQKVSAGFDLYWRNHDFLAPDYRVMRFGGDLRAGTPVNFSWVPQLGKYIGSIRADLTAIGEVISVDVDDSLDYGDRVLVDYARRVRRVNPKTGRIHAVYPAWAFATKDKYLEEDKGSFVQFSPVLTLTRDTRDSILLPTRGGETKLIGKVGLGSAIYGLTELKHAHYFKLFETFPRKQTYFFSGPHVLETRGAIGFATPNTPLFDRFFLGGPYEMRGFGYRRAGPRDFSGENPLGGTTKLFGSVEYTFPIFTYNDKFSIRGAVFMDVGNVWWKTRKYIRATRNGLGDWYPYEVERSNIGEINLSGGVGLRVHLPIGPLRLDYGIPFIRDSESRDWTPFEGFSFNAGASF
ncbi:MAG: outer membrane protein assembly factor BamA [bacterium]|nr:outer membrane protein assembly factor BamA [bacterium]